MTQKERLAKLKEQLIQKEIENRKKEQAYYEKITSGFWWKIYQAGMIFCILFMLTTTVDTFVSRDRVQLSQNEWKFDREYYIIGYQSIWVDGSIFFPPFEHVSGFDENSFEVENSLIFNKPKVLYFDQVPYGETQTVERSENVHYKTIFNWFPYLQIAMLLPLAVFILRKPKSWFVFARGMSMGIIYPLLIVLFVFLVI
jgi:hypothetical protein